MPPRKGSTAKRPAPVKHTSTNTQNRASAQPKRNSVQVQQRPATRNSPTDKRSPLQRAPSNAQNQTRHSPQTIRPSAAPTSSLNQRTQPAPVDTRQSTTRYTDSRNTTSEIAPTRNTYDRHDTSRQTDYRTNSPIFASQHHHYGASLPSSQAHQVQGYSPQRHHHQSSVTHYDAQGRPLHGTLPLDYGGHGHSLSTHHIEAGHETEQEKRERERWERDQRRKEGQNRQGDERRDREESKGCGCVVS